MLLADLRSGNSFSSFDGFVVVAVGRGAAVFPPLCACDFIAEYF
jgi:hypothetical protein